MISPILQTYLQNNYMLITPNNRLSQEIQTAFYIANKQKVIVKPNCIPYQMLLQKMFYELQQNTIEYEHPLLISMLQQRHLWKQILQQDSHYSVGFLDSVQQSWARCQQFGLDINHAEFQTTPAAQIFQHYSKEFAVKLKAMHAITESHLAAYICNNPIFCKATHIVWCCFDDWTPEQRLLQQTLQANNIKQIIYDNPIVHNAQVFQYRALNEQDENLQWISWAKAQLAAGCNSIGIVVPDLAAKIRPLQRLLADNFAKEDINLSRGPALIEYPLVAHAFLGLKLNLTAITAEQIYLLLHSPYFHESEYIARSHAWQELAILHETLPWDMFLQQIAPRAQDFAACLRQLNHYPKNTTIYEWVCLFKERLIGLNFVSGTQYSSEQYQCFERFSALLDEFLQLSLITPTITLQEALDALEDMAQKTLFQPQQPRKARIHVLGLLEAAGCVFDKIWITGLHDNCLPASTQFSPLIPIALQHEYNMPRTSIHKEQELAEKLLNRLQFSTSVYSYAAWCGDLPQLPSPLISHLQHTPAINNLLPNQKTQKEYNPTPDILPLKITEPLIGNSNLLTYQAQCPFRAFAAMRLRAQPIEVTTDGLNPRERGIILHYILELVWRHLATHATLLSYDTQALRIYIDKCITQAFNRHTLHKPYSFPVKIQQIERARLQKLVNNCLNWDKQRAPFKVAALEKNYTLELSSLTIRLRIDRLDLDLTTSKQWLIDYKTSLPKTLPWDEQRLESPQLPLYALLEESIQTVLFLQLKVGTIAIKGLAANKCNEKGIQIPPNNNSWEDYKTTWQQQLTTQALEYEQGLITPQPYKEATCNTCEFRGLCRKM